MKQTTNMGEQLQKLLGELELPCILKEVQESPSYMNYHFDLVDIEQLNLVHKKVKFASAYLHKDITINKSNTGHFSLSIAKENRDSVSFYDKTYDYLFNRETRKMELFVGLNDEGVPYTINLEDMPHILIGGTTGAGKSVVINGLICSLLRNSEAGDTLFYFIDTKRVELSLYRELEYGTHKIATDFYSAIELLENVCRTIEDRYEIMEEKRIRKIKDEFPRIVVVIEELGDLMNVSKKAVEKYIVKIAQLGRACGVHLIVATQRPDANTITGQIKSNIACRLALQTVSAVDSRIILDKKGAEQLKGKGDALLKVPTLMEEIHLQCPYVTEEDIEKTIEEFNRLYEE